MNIQEVPVSGYLSVFNTSSSIVIIKAKSCLSKYYEVQNPHDL